MKTTYSMKEKIKEMTISRQQIEDCEFQLTFWNISWEPQIVVGKVWAIIRLGLLLEDSSMHNPEYEIRILPANELISLAELRNSAGD